MAAGDPGSPARYYSSTAIETALSGAIGAQAQGAANTSFIVGSASGFPTSYPYTLIIDPDTSKEEVLTVFAGSGTTLSVYRGADGTQGVAHSAGAVVRHGVSGRDFREAENHIAARGYDIDQTILDAANQTHVHGIATGDGVIVGTLKAQTLTQKTLTTPTINGATVSGAVTSSATVTGGTFTAVTVTSSTISTSTLTGSFTASAATFVSPTISGSPVITGLSSAGMVNSSATPKIYVDAILGDATAAAISAASAAASATAAATSATSAATSAGSSETSAISSATSATAAATSAASAATSSTAATTSATSAAASATAAATSATSAAASATTAAASVATIAGYATSAANSASAAATSATSAAASESAAATSATSAAASTSAAAASASAAATSATSALASQTASATSATSAATSATAAATSAASAATSASSALTSQTASATSATSAATSASSALTSATSAATTYDEFDDRYLGSKSSAPTVDNDGNPLLVGAIYWNSTLNNMYVWSGSVWVQIATTTSYSAPTLGSTSIASGATVSNVDGLTINSTTIPTSKTLVVTTDKLSALAATTSAELAGVISDETGTGALVFANTPTLVTPALGVATATSVNGTTIPSSKTLVDTDSSQTLTNKTLTGPIVNLITSAQTASYTLVLTDSSDLVEISNASANNLTVPLDSSVAFPVGAQINILQTGAGQTTVVATGGVTINATPGLKLRAQWSSATLIKRATDTWVLVGDLSA